MLLLVMIKPIHFSVVYMYNMSKLYSFSPSKTPNHPSWFIHTQSEASVNLKFTSLLYISFPISTKENLKNILKWNMLKFREHRKSSVQREILNYKQCYEISPFVNELNSQVKKWREERTDNQKARRRKRIKTLELRINREE